LGKKNATLAGLTSSITVIYLNSENAIVFTRTGAYNYIYKMCAGFGFCVFFEIYACIVAMLLALIAEPSPLLFQ
jgi:hypothetical protein